MLSKRTQNGICPEAEAVQNPTPAGSGSSDRHDAPVAEEQPLAWGRITLGHVLLALPPASYS
jgi:hypothetical protein